MNSFPEKFAYRPDIDGLRGIAVVAVILFHAKFDLFRGGFVGVDIFFVISGFLITSISMNEWSAGKFGVLNFFEKRARRILPALLLVMVASVPFALTIPNPLQTKQFLESALYALSFLSNFHFWAQTGYFDTSAELKPLLHTWSLAVEEQYYILFPFFFLGLLHLNKKVSITILIAAFLFSLFTAQILISYHYKLAAFYLLPARVWEILAGVFCAVVFRSQVLEKVGRRGTDLLATLGLGLVLVSIPVFNDNTITPGPHALIPVVGTMLIILFSRTNGPVGSILSIRPLVFIGLISFSAYLWHQPVFAFTRLYVDEKLTTLAMTCLCILLVPLSYVSWKFVEVPFRDQMFVPFRRFAGIGFALTSGVFLVAVVGIGNYGYIYYRYPEKIASEYETVLRSVNYDFEDAMYDNGSCVFSSRTLNERTVERYSKCVKRHGEATIVIGDSHGMNIYNVLAKSGKYEFLFGLASHGLQAHKSHTYNWYHEKILNFVASNEASVKYIVYHQTGSTLWNSGYNNGKGTSVKKYMNFENLDKVAKYLELMSRHSPTIWLGPYTDYGQNPVDAVFERSKRNMSEFNKGLTDMIDARMISLSDDHDYSYFRFSSLYQMPDSPFFSHCTLFKDSDHLSSCGETMVAKWIAERDKISEMEHVLKAQ
ncbi:acyltransferase family protein [Roseibium sp.]|uniref:acyltransferase family protein n=1 Tax=Roseibium sp. TaxID=1936156 RepID=UPI003D150504